MGDSNPKNNQKKKSQITDHWKNEKKYDSLEQWLKETIGVSEKFLASLDAYDDWTFIIKIHTMIEGGLVNLLLTRLAAPLLAKAVSRLGTGNQKTGKLAFVTAFELLTSAECRFIQILSEMRNRCAHDVKSFHFDIKAHVGALDENGLNIWRKDFEFIKSEYAGNIWLQNLDVVADPRGGMLAASGVIMASIRSKQKDIQLKHEKEQS